MYVCFLERVCVFCPYSQVLQTISVLHKVGEQELHLCQDQCLEVSHLHLDPVRLQQYSLCDPWSWSFSMDSSAIKEVCTVGSSA